MDNKEPQVEPEESKKNDKKKKLLLLLLLLLILFGGIYIGLNWNNWFGDRPTVNIDANAQNQKHKKKNNGTLAIPGYESMTMKAGTKAQKVNLYNPKENKCYFRLSIYLPDGTKVWQSQMIKPGKAIYNLNLNQTLKAGTYKNCTLRYECFALSKKLVPLNGSQINFTLNVVE
ncbi:tRNA (uracil-5-)-methyltransferase [Ligilactobacillus agilis]|uniref:tRNA (uracil-5-)-methyltransferase n=1 Tax=Ligilactobacillus agilis TaxID=1601 RepID=UPI00143758EA|nr:tRNA (uracil-5-)-methyltransferase [Ligilactobacillus agilis]GET15460.1 hypothetical protein SN4111_17220 [Ligilactobacillus agilis]